MNLELGHGVRGALGVHNDLGRKSTASFTPFQGVDMSVIINLINKVPYAPTNPAMTKWLREWHRFVLPGVLPAPHVLKELH